MPNTPLEFMERVLPWPGPEGSGWGNLHYSLTKDGSKRWRGQPFKTAEALIERAQKLTMAPADKCEDIFFCTSIQSTTDTMKYGDRTFTVASRHANTAVSLKAIWLDVDIKDPPKGYASLKGALDAIDRFCTAAKLPGPSAFVLSGGGVHVYWISDRALGVEDWRPFAEGLKHEAMRLGLRCDYGVTTDAARILRVPGTYNRKIAGQPRPVKVLGLGADHNFDVALADLKKVGEPHVTATVNKSPFDLSAFQGVKMHPLLAATLANCTDKLSDGIDRYPDLPLLPDEVIAGCPHFMDAAVHRGQGHGQGLWMLTVLASTFFEDGKKWAKRFSDKYPTYDEAEFDAMWARKMDDRAKGMGWPSCKSFENEGCKSCATCVYKPLGKSPLNLAQRAKPPEEEQTTIPVDPTVPDGSSAAAPLTAVDLHLPDGYVLRDGKICWLPPAPEDDDAPAPIPQPIFHGYVTARPWTSNGVPCTLHFKYRQGVNNVEVSVPYDKTGGEGVLQSCLSGQTVMARNDKLTRAFMKSWIAQIDEESKRLTSAPFGWVIENGNTVGFAYGGKLFKTNGTEEDAGYPHQSVQAIYTPTGRIEPIMEALDVLHECQSPGLQTLALQAWASPLLTFAGLKATICWGWSDGSGAMKSTALRTGMALWAAPDLAKEQRGVTAAGLETKLNNLKNLPVYIDEVTDEIMLDALLPAIQTVPEGGSGTRSTRGGEQRAKKYWAAVLVCGANKSMHEHQVMRGATTDAKAARVFEVKLPKQQGKRNKTEVDTLIASLDNNFGHLGLLYAKFLATNYEWLQRRYRAIADDFEKALAPVENQERFWKATVAMTLLAAECANLILAKEQFDLERLRKYLIETFENNRSWVATHVDVGGEEADSTKLMMMVLDKFMNNTLVTDRVVKGTGNKTKVSVLQQPPQNAGHGNPVHLQWVVDPPLLRISLPALKDYFREGLKTGVNRLVDMKKIYGGKDVKKVNMFAGTDLITVKARVDVWEMPINQDHPLYDMWHAKAFHGGVMPATPISAALTEQDGLAAAVAQAAKDTTVVAAAGG